MTTTQLTPNIEAARAFLKLLDNRTDRFSFHTFDDVELRDQPKTADGKYRKRGSAKLILSPLHGTLDACWHRLVKNNLEGAGVFVSINETDFKGAKNENTIAARAIWQEQDDGAPWTAPLPFDIEVISSVDEGITATHRYLLVEDELPLEEWDWIQALMADRFGSDPGVKDRRRVMRLPGTLWNKDPANRQLVRVSRASTMEIWPGEKVLAAFAPFRQPKLEHAKASDEPRAREKAKRSDVANALRLLPADEREVWFEIGCALHAWDAIEGGQLWAVWSKKSGKYDRADQDRVWRSIHDKKARNIGIGTLFHLAKQHGFAFGRSDADDEFSVIDPEELRADKVVEKFRRYSSTRMSDITEEHIDWLWPDRIPRGMISMFGGMPGVGKSMFTYWLASVCTNGGTFPDGTVAPKGNVIVINAEDHPKKVMKPRLKAAGADSSRVHQLDGVFDADKPKEKRFFDLKRIPELLQLIEDVGDVVLVIIDPVMSYIAGKDSNNDAEVRSALLQLNDAAERKNFAVLLVTHLNKSTGAALDRFMGSRAFTGLPRSAWISAVEEDDDGNEHCVFALAKTNVGPSNIPGWAYTIETLTLDSGVKAQRIKFKDEPVHKRADELLRPKSPEEQGELDNAIEFVTKFLGEQMKLANDLYAAAKEEGISKASINRARKALRVRYNKANGTGLSVVWLPRCDPPGDPNQRATDADEEFSRITDEGLVPITDN